MLLDEQYRELFAQTYNNNLRNIDDAVRKSWILQI